jgi:hypothetical protein
MMSYVGDWGGAVRSGRSNIIALGCEICLGLTKGALFVMSMRRRLAIRTGCRCCMDGGMRGIANWGPGECKSQDIDDICILCRRSKINSCNYYIHWHVLFVLASMSSVCYSETCAQAQGLILILNLTR